MRQNIQDCCYNCSNLRRAKDDLAKTTSYTPHEDDNRKFEEENEDTVDLDEMAEMLQQLDDVGVRDVNPKRRSLNIIAQRHNIAQQDIPPCTQDIPDIMAIPQHITDSINIHQNNSNICIQNDNLNGFHSTDGAMSCDMVIDILNDVVLEGLPLSCSHYDPQYHDVLASSSQLSFKAIIKKFTLDFKQSVAFEIMASSFILKSLKIERITEDVVRTFFHNNETRKNKYTICLSGLKEKMKDMGGEENLVMFLSGMGGTGKSEVIKAFVEFAGGISLIFGWNYDTDVVKITALTGAAACQIPNGKTLHSTACLSSTKIGKNRVES